MRLVLGRQETVRLRQQRLLALLNLDAIMSLMPPCMRPKCKGDDKGYFQGYRARSGVGIEGHADRSRLRALWSGFRPSNTDEPLNWFASVTI